ncbi:MAG TPA: hypothetical protein VFG30_32220 [Polyangiales bacterium]|nr:hypothetical protein [Polyangiales bacterium]
MHTLKKLALSTLAVGALLAAAGSASAQSIAKKEYDAVAKNTIEVPGGGGTYRTSSYRFWDKWQWKDEVTSRATNNLHVHLGDSALWTIYQSKAEGYALRRTGVRTVKVSGYIRFRGNTVVEIPETTGVGDAGLDQNRPLGTITFFSASADASIATITLTLKGQLSSTITSWAHVAANPLAANESDFSLTSSKINAALIARGSVTVLTVGVYGSVKPIEGNIGPVASVSRVNYPLPEGGESTLFTSHASAPATIGFFAGEVGATAFGIDFPAVEWNSPWSFTTQMYTPQNLSDWAHKPAAL